MCNARPIYIYIYIYIYNTASKVYVMANLYIGIYIAGKKAAVQNAERF